LQTYPVLMAKVSCGKFPFKILETEPDYQMNKSDFSTIILYGREKMNLHF